MSTTTTHYCDRCKAVNPEQLWEIGISAQHTVWPSKASLWHKAEWCRDCCREGGLAFQFDKPEPARSAPPTQPTLEDMLREIIRAELAAHPSNLKD